jgi:signal transduction histidine kinase
MRAWSSTSTATSSSSCGESNAHELLGIAREATSNVLRHACARSLSIRLTREDGHLVLQLQDDGQGFDADGPARGSGAGLAHMAQRASRIGGSFSLTSSAGAGTLVRVRVPVP